MLSLNGIPLRDFPKLLWTRWTYCRKQGCLFGKDGDYCLNCGKPYLYKKVEPHG